MIETLKCPVGEFTQAELATFNGMEKLAVYLPLQAAIKGGALVKTGTRPQVSGRGKPSNLYRITDLNAPLPVPAPQVPQPIPETPPAQSTSYIETAPVILVPQSIVETAPVPIAKAMEATSPHQMVPNPAYPCPLCQGPMTVTITGTGVMVKCYNNPCDPQCHENPYGHGRNAKDAYEVAKQKFRQ